MANVLFMFFVVFFAATIYASVVLIQIGGWLPILAGLLLICSYFACGSISLLGVGIAAKRTSKKEEGLK